MFCRKADPESKGKIENVIKYIKYNFLRGRLYKSINLLQKESVEWLKRRGNGKSHGTTRKVPQLEWQKEKKHLYPLMSTPVSPQNSLPEYLVRKDNCITYRGSYYSLPGGTYGGKGTKVLLEVKGSSLCVYDIQKNKIVQHLISKEKGTLVRNENHRRSSSMKKEETYKEVLRLLDHQHAKLYLEQLEQDKPRYYHDNLKVLMKNLQGVTKGIIGQALEVCLENRILNAYEFGQVIRMCKKKLQVKPTANSLAPQSIQGEYLLKDMDPEVSNINYYETLLR